MIKCLDVWTMFVQLLYGSFGYRLWTPILQGTTSCSLPVARIRPRGSCSKTPEFFFGSRCDVTDLPTFPYDSSYDLNSDAMMLVVQATQIKSTGCDFETEALRRHGCPNRMFQMWPHPGAGLQTSFHDQWDVSVSSSIVCWLWNLAKIPSSGGPESADL